MTAAVHATQTVRTAQRLDGNEEMIGPVSLPGTGRTIWWTGRVAIGLRHQPMRSCGPVTQSELWLQGLLLSGSGERLAGA